MADIKSTTIVAVRHGGKLAFAGDGQVTLGNTIVKHGAVKIRRIKGMEVLTGFAGSAADSFTLFERFEAKLEQFSGKLAKAAVSLARDWRNDKFLRKLEAMMIVADSSEMFLLSGGGDVIQPDDGVLAIGSGGNFALAAARALLRTEGHNLSAAEIAETAMTIAAEICPFTNNSLKIEEI